jgi:hypothetical protein
VPTTRINSVYLSGWEYNRLLSADPTTPRNSALPASILWKGAHQLWMFENIYVTKEAWENELYATDQLGWVMGDVLRFLWEQENAVTILNWAEFDYDLRECLKAARAGFDADVHDLVRAAIRDGDPGRLEGLKNRLLAPVLDRFGCMPSGAPTELGNWRPQRASCENNSGSTASLLHAGVAELVVPGIQTCRSPGTLATAYDRERQRQVQTKIEAPMIPDLLAGEREFAGSAGYVPYIDALKKHRAAYAPVNDAMRADWLSQCDNISRLRDVARERLWPHLHNEWLPNILEDTTGQFVRRDFPRLIKWALRGSRFARVLDNTQAKIIIGCVTAAALERATDAAGIPAEIAGGAAAVAAGTAGVRYREQIRQVTDLAVFYQRARVSSPAGLPD